MNSFFDVLYFSINHPFKSANFIIAYFYKKCLSGSIKTLFKEGYLDGLSYGAEDRMPESY